MRRGILFVILAISVAFSGTISGELIYPDGGFGLYIVVAVSKTELAESIAVHGSSFDIADFLLSLPRDELFMPGSYSIEGDFHDGVAYTVFGFKPEGMELAPGTPMGVSPMDVFTTGGNARDVPVELATEATIGGHITYPGDFPGCKVNVYDNMSGSPVLDGTYTVHDVDYSLTLPSGFKTLEFYIDENGNGQWDPELLESGAYYTDLSGEGFGPFVFVGGGGRFRTGVDVALPPSAIMESKSAQRCDFSVENNRISYDISGEGEIYIYDIGGKLVNSFQISGKGAIDISKNLPTGVYLIRIGAPEIEKSTKISIIR